MCARDQFPFFCFPEEERHQSTEPTDLFRLTLTTGRTVEIARTHITMAFSKTTVLAVIAASTALVAVDAFAPASSQSVSGQGFAAGNGNFRWLRILRTTAVAKRVPR